MKKTTLEMFREELLRTGGYVSAPERMAPRPRRKGRLTTLGFCWSVFSVFPKCSVWETFRCLTTDKWAHFCFETLRASEWCGAKFTAEGWNSRRDYQGPVVYVANHMSTLETVMLPFILLTYGPFNTVAKASLLHLPGLERAAAHMGLIPVGRTNPREDLLTLFRIGGERIARGESVLIFSQGTRQPVFARKGWSSIGAKLAEKAGVPVMPIALKTDIMLARPKEAGGGLGRDFGTVDPTKDVRVACGPVLTGSSKEMHQASFDWIKAKLDSWNMPTEG